LVTYTINAYLNTLSQAENGEATVILKEKSPSLEYKLFFDSNDLKHEIPIKSDYI
jgi:hypothetical protein